MATIKGLWFLKDSFLTAGFPKTNGNIRIAISGKVYKNGWADFNFINVYVDDWGTYLYTKLAQDAPIIEDVDLVEQNKWWDNFKEYRYFDFGDTPQEVNDDFCQYLLPYLEQVDRKTTLTSRGSVFSFKDTFDVIDMATNTMPIPISGSSYGVGVMYMAAPIEMYGEVMGWTDENYESLGVSRDTVALGYAKGNMITMEFEVAELVYINDTWIKPEYQKFTLEQDLPTALINKMLKYITPVGSKGPNYTALDNALDRLAAVIAERTGAELPLTLEEMLKAAKEIGQAALISFTISGTTYQAEEGMTWQQWVNSDYNTNNKYRRGGGMSMYVEETAKRNYYIYDTTTNNCVLLEDIIEVNGVYNTKYVDPVGGEIN